ncbi:MAG: endoglucanase [Verrucomicrobia bacterium]|nr:endoglucanase [Verrucomicrobiota bacterium]
MSKTSKGSAKDYRRVDMYNGLLLANVTFLMAFVFAIAPGSAGEGPIPPEFGFAIEGLPTRSELRTLVSDTGVQPRLVLFYLQWPQKPEAGEFPGLALRAIESIGALPVLTWEPMFVDSEKGEQMIPAEHVTTGKYDLYLEQFARGCRQFGKLMLIRFAHEMNLARYHWGGAASEFGPDSPARYRAMYRYVVAKFRAQRVDNVRWVFCPNADSVPAAQWNRIAAYYPGDDVVDVVGLDGYNWGTTQTKAANGWDSQWRTFESVFSAPLKELKQIAPRKPVGVFETSSADLGGNKEEWVMSALDSARSLGLGALVWFQVNKEIDWRLQTHVSEAVRSAIQKQNASIPAGPPWLGITGG